MTTDLAHLPGNLPANPPGFGASSAPTGAGPRLSPIVRYLSALRRFKWLVLLLTLVGLGAGYLVSRLRPATFEVKSSIALPDPTTNASSALQGAPLYAANQWSDLIKTYLVTQTVAEQRRLYIIGPTHVGDPPPPPGPNGPAAVLFNNFALGPQSSPGDFQWKISRDGTTYELDNTTTGGKESGTVGDSVGRRFGFQLGADRRPTLVRPDVVVQGDHAA